MSALHLHQGEESDGGEVGEIAAEEPNEQGEVLVGDLVMGHGVNAKRSRATLSCGRDGAAALPPMDGEVSVPAALRYV